MGMNRYFYEKVHGSVLGEWQTNGTTWIAGNLWSKEEAERLAKWILEGPPEKRYRIIKTFDEKPLGVWFRTEYNLPDGAFSINENEIEEVFE